MKSLKKLLGKEEPNPVCKNIRYSQEWQGMRRGSLVQVMKRTDKMFMKIGKVHRLNYPEVIVVFGKGPIRKKQSYLARNLKLIKDWEVVEDGKSGIYNK